MSASISSAILRWALRRQLDAKAISQVPLEMLGAFARLPQLPADSDVKSVVRHLEKRERRPQLHAGFEHSPRQINTDHLFRYTREARVVQRPIFGWEPPARVEKGEPLDTTRGSICEVYWSIDRQYLIKKVRPNYHGFLLTPAAVTRVRDDVVSGAALLRDGGYVVTPMLAQGEDELITVFAKGAMFQDLPEPAQERAMLLAELVSDAARRRFPQLDVDPGPDQMTYTPEGDDCVEWFDPVLGLRRLKFEPGQHEVDVAA